MHRKYDDKIPNFLRNRPKGVVQHIMKRSHPQYPSNYIRSCGNSLFMVQSASSDEQYQVWLGSQTQLPTCQCIDYKKNKMPCKHICGVVNLPDVGWESLGTSFQNHPLFKLDPIVVTSVSCDEQKAENDASPNNDINNHVHESTTTPENNPNHGSQVKYNQLKRRRQGPRTNGRNKCIAAVKALHDELYMVTDQTVLDTLNNMITNALTYARQNRPAESKLPLKDKTLSPCKKRKRAQKCAKFPVRKLPLRADKKRKKKRFGVGADNREKASNITIGKECTPDNKKGNSKTPEKNAFIDLTELVGDQLDDKTSTWLTVEGITLTAKLEKVLLNPSVWLTDEHVDAAERLLKSERDGIGGLNDIVMMTHFDKKTKVDLATKARQTIQCHNIGSHWVVSTSINGKVTVYDTLSTGLNNVLLQQLLHLYRAYSDDSGHLTVTIILQQQQNGPNDCGLFCIANATSLAHGIDPALVTWDQSKLRAHLHECFVNKKLTMFPHTRNNKGNKYTTYKLSF